MTTQWGPGNNQNGLKDWVAVDAIELRGDTLGYVRRAAHGEPFMIMSQDTVVAMLIPAPQEQAHLDTRYAEPEPEPEQPVKLSATFVDTAKHMGATTDYVDRLRERLGKQ